MKRSSIVAGVVLGIALIHAPLFAAGSNETTGAAGSAGQPYEVTMAFLTFGNTPSDLPLVQDAVSKIATDKSETTVKFLPINIGTWSQQMNLMLASGERLDLMVTGSSPLFNYSLQVAKGELLPLDSLIAKYGQGISRSMAPDYLSASKIGGKIYGIPSVRDFAASEGVMLRKDLVDQYGIDTKSIRSYDDLDAVLKLVHQKQPDLTLLTTGVVNTSVVSWMRTWDLLGDGYGVLPNFGQELKVVDIYETPEYAALLDKVRAWYLAGYIQQDVVTNKDHWSVFMKAGKLFGYFNIQKPGIEGQDSTQAATPLVAVPIVKPFATTSTVTGIMWSIPRNSKNPDKSMQFLNLMYSDPAVVNLLDWGIEGRDYVKTSDGRIDFPPGVTAATSGYNLNLGWQFGNQLLSYVWKSDPIDLWKQLQDFNSSAVKSKALGFTFNSDPVKTEIAAVSNVVSQYGIGLECGVLDPKQMLPVFISKLKAAGIDRIVAEKQKQLDAWAAQ